MPAIAYTAQTTERRYRFSVMFGATLPRKHAGELALIRTVAGLRLFVVDGSASTTASFGPVCCRLTRKAHHARRISCHQSLPRQLLT